MRLFRVFDTVARHIGGLKYTSDIRRKIGCTGQLVRSGSSVRIGKPPEKPPAEKTPPPDPLLTPS
eukprot:20547-Prorocentrum_minimum.AAC.1